MFTLKPKIRKTLNELIDTGAQAEFVISILSDRMQNQKAKLYAFLSECDNTELLAESFGHTRQWRLVKKPFQWNALLRNMPYGDETLLQVPPCSDHPFFYVDRDGKPAAIAAHECHFNDNKRADCELFGMMTGLGFETPDDFPSWWSKSTTLVLWTAQTAQPE